MDLDTLGQIQQILYYIEEYENGNDGYYDAIIEIIKAIKAYQKTAKKNYKRTKIVLSVSKLATLVTNSYLKDERVYQQMMDNCYSDLEYYLESSKKLEEYVKICSKTQEFPDLEAAYILTIKLSLILENIMDYTKEIRLMEKASTGLFTYYPSDNLETKAEANRRDVELLVKTLELRGDENVPRN